MDKAGKRNAKIAVKRALQCGGEKRISEGNHYSGVSASGLSEYFFGKDSQDDLYDEEDEDVWTDEDYAEISDGEAEEWEEIDGETVEEGWEDFEKVGSFDGKEDQLDLYGEWDEGGEDVEIDEEEEEKNWRKQSIDHLLDRNRTIKSSNGCSKEEEEGENLKKENDNLCRICLDEMEEDSIPICIQGCKHTFCKECLANYIAFKTQDASSLFHQVTFITKEGNLRMKIEVVDSYGIPCPALNCRHILLINELVPVVTPQTMDQFLRFSAIHKRQATEIEEIHEHKEDIMGKLSNYKSSKFDKDAKICPICNERVLGRIVRVRKSDGSYSCGHISYCNLCNQPHPKNMNCFIFAMEGRSRSDIIDSEGVHHCKKCFAPIFRDGGCNHMSCKCGHSFCWLCGGSYSSPNHYPQGIRADVCEGLLKKRAWERELAMKEAKKKQQKKNQKKKKPTAERMVPPPETVKREEPPRIEKHSKRMMSG